MGADDGHGADYGGDFAGGVVEEGEVVGTHGAEVVAG